MSVYIEVSNQIQFDEALQKIEDGQVLVIVNATESIVAQNIKKTTIEIRDGVLVAIHCGAVVALNESKVLSYYSTVYASDRSEVLNARGMCMAYDSATCQKIF